MRQFILENQSLKNGVATISGKDFRYLRQVLRVKNGDMLNVRFPDGSLNNMTVAFVDDKAKKVTLQICSTAEDLKFFEKDLNSQQQSITRGVQANEINNSFNGKEFWLFQFLPKAQKFEQIVRQATECGISKIIPIIGEYTEKSSVFAIQGAKKERLERIIREARQQSGSPVQTKLEEAMSLDQAIELWNNFLVDSKEDSLGVVLSERKDNCVELSSLKTDKKSKVCLAVGNEGGISPEEITKLIENGRFKSLHFDINILRCETAALYGIAVMQSVMNIE